MASVQEGAVSRQPRRRASVVRTLLRRYVTLWRVAWYWREATARTRYAAPDVEMFETDMTAPVFTTVDQETRRDERGGLHLHA